MGVFAQQESFVILTYNLVIRKDVIKQVMVDSDYLLLPEFKQRKKETAAWLAQLGERRSAEREVAGSKPGRTNTQGF